MLVKVKTDIIIEVRDAAQAEAASATIDMGLENQIARSFPEGEIVAVDVDTTEPVSDEEAAEKGWVE
jgi:hypothetical protein